MQLRILSVAQKLPAWVELACGDYLRRLPRELTPQLVDLPLAARDRRDVAGARREEGGKILGKLTPDSFNLALDERGELWSSRDWARQLEQWMAEYPRVNLIVGGPDGLDDAVLVRSRCRVALGRITLPHALVRVVLVEQIYRAWTIVRGHPYHRE